MPNVKAQMPKKTKEEWNDGTLEYWFRQKILDSLTLFHHSTIPLFQNYLFKF
jgi:hypothetical protein